MSKEYRWWLIFFHAAKELYRQPGNRWFVNKEECEKDSEAFDFDFCCGFEFIFEERIAEISEGKEE